MDVSIHFHRFCDAERLWPVSRSRARHRLLLRLPVDPGGRGKPRH